MTNALVLHKNKPPISGLYERQWVLHDIKMPIQNQLPNTDCHCLPKVKTVMPEQTGSSLTSWTVMAKD